MGSQAEHPYRYPKFKHIRTQTPRPAKDYRVFKPCLRVEFDGKCVYCRRPDSAHPHDVNSFAVEHYRPKKRFPDLVCEYTNLFYACSHCNSKKGQYWPNGDDEPRVLNPCDFVMTEHVSFQAGAVEGRSNEGRFFVDLLGLNDPKLVAHRQSVMKQAQRAAHELKEVTRLLVQLRKRRAAAADIASLEAKHQEIEDFIASLNGRQT